MSHSVMVHVYTSLLLAIFAKAGSFHDFLGEKIFEKKDLFLNRRVLSSMRPLIIRMTKSEDEGVVSFERDPFIFIILDLLPCF